MRFPTDSTGVAPEGQPAPIGNPASGADPADRLDPRYYIGIVLTHWWVVLLVLLLGTGAGAAYCVLAKPIYRAECRYEVIQESRLNVVGDRSSVGLLERLNTRLGRQVMIMQNPLLRQEVLAALRPKWEATMQPKELSPELSIRPVRSTGTMLDIKVEATSGEYALAFLNQLLQSYQSSRRSAELDSNDSAVRRLRQEQEALGGEYREAEDQLIEFQREHNVQFANAKQRFDEKFLAGLVQRENALRLERTSLEAQFEFLKDANAATIQDVLALTLETHDTTVVGKTHASGSAGVSTAGAGHASGGRSAALPLADWQSQEAAVLRLQAEYDDLLKTYKPGHPKAVALKQEVDRARRELRFRAEISMKRLMARYDALKMQEAALGRAAHEWRSELKLAGGEQATYERLQARVKRLKQLHDQVYSRILDINSRRVDSQYARMVIPPSILPRPVRPAKLKIMLAAVVAALGAGLAFAFLLDYLDTSFSDLVAIEERLGLQFLGGIPDWRRVLDDFDPDKQQVVVARGKQNAATEAYRSLRASLDSVIGGKKGYSLVVTSADASEGKSFTASNLAVTMAWTGCKVLLVDADLRRGALRKTFGVDARQGLSSLLLGEVGDWHDVVCKTAYENLSLLPTGPHHEHAPEFMGGSRIRQLLDDCATEYDLIILDGAPIGRVADTLMLARACDGVLMLVRHNVAKFGEVRSALRRLAGSNVIGFCVNAINLPSRSYGGYGGYYGRYGRYASYGYYSHYGYGYYGRKDKDASAG